ncbi:ATP-dependent DNA helicase pfh1-like isoform X1 [Silene latifolia]|uniref:ATP-dependent DNA helicase pfh1-like isoform X1 n=1 Tax=Silene latifolia TaxID=37657 RepID=UPI003D7819DE
MGKTMATFGLDHLDTCNDDEIRRTRDIVDALDAPIPEECKLCKAQLNNAQKEAFTTIMEHVQRSKPGAFFVDGPGGTGKTFLYNALYAEVRLMGKIVLPTATSGIAAANIPTGRTTHSRFKIPLECEVSLACDVPKQSSLAALIVATSLIIWDEASMSKRQNIESLDILLRDLCDPNQLFGGKVVVFGGDFRQTLPILPRKSQQEVVEASLVSSPLWPQLQKFRLTENIRAQSDPEFARFLLSLGNGQLQTKEHEYIELPAGLVQVVDASNVDPITDLAVVAFPELYHSGTFGSNIFTNRAILTPLNEDVDAINSVLIDKFPGEPVTYTSHDSMLDDNCAVYPAEFINKLNPGGMSPHELVLKINCPVILIRNLQPSFGLCNGTRLICKRFLPNSIECVIMTGQHTGDHVFIPRIKLRPGPSTNYPFQFQRNQFPLKLSFAMTVNKCQGQTLSQVAVYLPRPCFSHGQLYVALSRARKASQVTVFSVPGPEAVPTTFVKNVVSYDALSLAEII